MLKPALVTIEDARRLVSEAVEPLPAEPVALHNALGRVTADAIRAPISTPRH